MKNEIKDMKNIIIIDCGPSLEDVSREYGQSPEWIMESLRYADCIFKWIKPYEGQTIKENTGDAWIITGSPHSVYDEDYWMLQTVRRIVGNLADRKTIDQLFIDNPNLYQINWFRNEEWKAGQLSKKIKIIKEIKYGQPGMAI